MSKTSKCFDVIVVGNELRPRIIGQRERFTRGVAREN